MDEVFKNVASINYSCDVLNGSKNDFYCKN